MNFVKFKNNLSFHFNQMTKDAVHLFEVGVEKDELWNVYLESFPEGTNPLYRKRRVHDCSCCRHFIRVAGNIVSIKNGEITTLWDFNAGSPEYQTVADALSSYVKSKAISGVFITKDSSVGTSENFENADGKIKKWNHFHIAIPSNLVDKSHRSIEEIKSGYRDTKNVFKRSLEDITEDSVLTILELITSKSIYRGEEWKRPLEAFLEYKRAYISVPEDKRDAYAWEKSVSAGNVVGRIRNHSIGTLLVNISEGMELDLAVKKYEQIVAPENYKRPNAIFTKKMLEDAKKTVEELGYTNSLTRRYATLDDITVNNILFSNKDAAKRIEGGSVFDELSSEVAVNPKKFGKVEEIPIDSFISNVLPTAKDLEILMESRLANNMVSLIAPTAKDSPTMFKWNNGFCWSYTGNITDSCIKENVKSMGGKVDGVLRFSIQWNEDGEDNCDLDAHCIEPTGNEIYFNNCCKPLKSALGGQLDVDVVFPDGRVAVENITYESLSKMKNGVYKFFVHQFSGSARSGFRAEIEFGGSVYSYDYNKPMRLKEKVQVAEVTLKDGVITMCREFIDSATASKKIWNINSNRFVPVSVVCYSPNYWDEQQGTGNKHYFFMLKDCINPESPNGFFNEYLKQELVHHKRVFEALGSKMKVESSDDQLSGVGFSSTQRNSLIVKVKGSTERVLKIKF